MRISNDRIIVPRQYTCAIQLSRIDLDGHSRLVGPRLAKQMGVHEDDGRVFEISTVAEIDAQSALGTIPQNFS